MLENAKRKTLSAIIGDDLTESMVVTIMLVLETHAREKPWMVAKVRKMLRTHTHTHTHTHIYIYIRTYTLMHTNVHSHTQTYTHINTHICYVAVI